jgi:hypothetical protein
MARQLVIVAREHPDLYSYLSERFTGGAQARVLLDRRLGQRRSERVPVPSERRRQDRRARQDVDTLLRSRSHVIVTVP